MALTYGVQGMVPHRRRSGSPWSFTRYKKEASVILAPGDPIVFAGSAETLTGIATVERASAGGTITGVMIARDVDRSDLSKKHFAAADTGYLTAVDDADGLYWMTEDGVGGFLALTDVGRGVDIIVANANTTVGVSQVMIDSSTAAGSGVTLRLEGLAQIEGNEVGSTSTVWEVSVIERTRGQTETLI